MRAQCSQVPDDRSHRRERDSIARQWIWWRLHCRADGGAIVPYRHQKRIVEKLVRAKQRQLDSMRDRVVPVHRLRDSAELVD
jgi:hypothetical protein